MDFKAVRRTDKNVVFGVAAAKQALADSGLEVDAPERRGGRRRLRLRASAVPGSWPDAIETLKTRAPSRSARSSSPTCCPTPRPGQIAIELGAKGPNMCIVTACSTGTHNIGEAAEGIRRGDFVTAISGSTETPLYEVGYVGFSQHARHGHAARGPAARRTSRGPSTGRATASCWARARARWSLEDLELAKARGATIYAEVVGYGSAADAWDLIQPVDKGDGTRRAMEMALAAPRRPARRGRPHQPPRHLDAARATCARPRRSGRSSATARREIAISGTKSMTGHLMGAAGAVEGVFTVLSVHHQIAPATLNYREPDPEIELDVVHGDAQPMEIRYAMSDNIGLGGHNGAVIFKRYDGRLSGTAQPPMPSHGSLPPIR